MKTIEEVRDSIVKAVVLYKQGDDGIDVILKSWSDQIVDRCAEVTETTITDNVDKQSILDVKQEIK